jgi:NADPH-dependent ferric siderophore reductase
MNKIESNRFGCFILWVFDVNCLTKIVLDGEALTDLQVRFPAQWIKLFLTAQSADKLEMTIDFFLHEEGTASEWAKRAQVGEELTFAGPAGTVSIFSMETVAKGYRSRPVLCESNRSVAMSIRHPKPEGR